MIFIEDFQSNNLRESFMRIKSRTSVGNRLR